MQLSSVVNCFVLFFLNWKQNLTKLPVKWNQSEQNGPNDIHFSAEHKKYKYRDFYTGCYWLRLNANQVQPIIGFKTFTNIQL